MIVDLDLLDDKTRWHWQRLEKRGWSVVAGKIEEITPETTWIRTFADERVAIRVTAEEINSIAQTGDTIRVALRRTGRETTQIYCLSTNQILLRRSAFGIKGDKASCLTGLAFMGTIIPGFGIFCAWIPLLQFIYWSLRTFKKLQSLLITLICSTLYLFINLWLSQSAISFKNVILVLIGNIVLLITLTLWLGAQEEKADSSVSTVLTNA